MGQSKNLPSTRSSSFCGLPKTNLKKQISLRASERERQAPALRWEEPVGRSLFEWAFPRRVSAARAHSLNLIGFDLIGRKPLHLGPGGNK